MIAIRGTNGWNAYTIKYLDQDSLLRAELSFDRSDQIEESIWGIALSMFEYDQKGRQVEKRYYDAQGQLYFSDWPPIIRLYYDEEDRIIRKDYFGKTAKPVSGYARIEFDYDMDGELVEERQYDGQYKLRAGRAIKRMSYENEGKTRITTYYDQNKELLIDKGIATYHETFRTANRAYILERRFLGEDGQLVETEDTFSGLRFALVRFHYGESSQGVRIEKFDAQMNLVNESWQYVPPQKNP